MAREPQNNFGGDVEFEDKVVNLNRVAKVVKGGRRFAFSALVVVGNRNGRVGIGTGKAREVPDAIRKATERARQNLVTVPIVDGTLPHEVLGHTGAGRVMLRPAGAGTGVIAGSSIKAVMELAGVSNVITKCIGSNNPHNMMRATLTPLPSCGPSKRWLVVVARPSKRFADRRHMLRVTQKRSLIGRPQNQRQSVKALGLRRIGHTVDVVDNDSTRGLVMKVQHLVDVEVIAD